MQSEPRYIGVSILDGVKNIYLVAVKTKHVPGALGDVATRMGKAGINILSTMDCSHPDNPQSTVSFFVEAKSDRATPESIEKVLRSSPQVIDCYIKKSESKLMVDDFAFPLMYFPAGRGILLPQSGVTAMFQDIVTMFGSGGESILFRAGYSVGTKGTEDIAKALGEEELAKNVDRLAALYSALGWGKMEILDASPNNKKYRLRLSEGFESSEIKASRPNCHFTRGLVAGSSERVLGRPVSCEEVECAAMGDAYCLFAVSIKARSDLQ